MDQHLRSFFILMQHKMIQNKHQQICISAWQQWSQQWHRTEHEQLGSFSGLDKYCKSPLQNDDFTGTLLLGQNLRKMCNLGTNAKWEPAGLFPLFPAWPHYLLRAHLAGQSNHWNLTN